MFLLLLLFNVVKRLLSIHGFPCHYHSFINPNIKTVYIFNSFFYMSNHFIGLFFLIQRSFSVKLNFLQIWIELLWYHFHKHTVSLPFLIPFLLFLPCASTQFTQCYFPTIINKCEAIHLVDSFLFLTPLFFIVGLFVISINQLLKFSIKYLILVFFLAY